MKSKFALWLALCAGALPNSRAQLCPPVIQSQVALRDAGFNTIHPTSDGGYILGGTSNPFGDSEQTSPSYGLGDFYLVRLDSAGTRLWDRTFGGSDWETALQLQVLPDGFILAGSSMSEPGGNKTSASFGMSDFWVIRTDIDGNKVWEQSFGGLKNDYVSCVQRTADGGFIIGGSSESDIAGNKTSPNYGDLDYWVLRVDGAGNKLWERSFGGFGRDVLTAIQQTPDGGFLLGGTSESDVNGNKTALSFGGRDYWVIRIDANGHEVWQNSFGGNLDDELAAIGQSSAGFALVGASQSDQTGTKTAPVRGYRDYWITFIDQNGTRIWDETAGGGYAEPRSVLLTVDGGWVIGGTASGPGRGGNKTSPTEGYSDYWLVRFNADGAILWDQTFGGNAEEHVYAMERAADGGILISGQSYSGAGGNRTVPILSYSDLWLVKLGVETPGDCDGDGVPDEQDLCAGSGAAIVNTNGCSIAQLCPCDGGWTNHADYVGCVDRTSAEFLAAGRLTSAERESILAEAANASCPFPPMLAFGLTNFPIHHATVSTESESGNQLLVSNLGFDGFDGVSMRLGEADAGVFIYPHAPVQDNFSPTWFMLGKAYGSVNGVSNSLVSTMRATKPYYEEYPVEFDFSTLGASSLTFQAYLGKMLVGEYTQAGPVGSVTIYSASYLGPRANPFWRAPDGSIGAVIDFDLTEGLYRFGISGLVESSESAAADRIYVRANNPTNRVDFVSRLDVFAGGGLYNFSALNARLGMFRHPHQILGPALFGAADGKLQIAHRPETEDQFGGTLIEAKQESLVGSSLEPVDLQTNGASLLFYASGRIGALPPENISQDASDMFGSATLTRVDEHLQVNANFSWLYPPPEGTNSAPTDRLVLIKVYLDHAWVGSLTNSGKVTDLVLTSSNGPITIVDTTAAVVGELPFFLSFSLQTPAVLNDGSGRELYGNRFRLSPIDPERQPSSISALTLGVTKVPSFTIVAETSEPALTISRAQDTVTLSWPNQNQVFVLESTSILGGSFERVAADVTLAGNRNTVTVPIDPFANRFFRLVLAVD